MNPLGRKGVLALALFVASLGAVAIVFFLRSTPDTPSAVPQPTKEAADRLKLQEALRDASLLDLIRNARVAARKGDSVTHVAMVSGLKREPQRSRTLITREISRTNDSTDISILNHMMTELP